MTHEERVFYHLYTKAKSPLENAEMIASLEELLLIVHDKCGRNCACHQCELYIFDDDNDDFRCCILDDRLRELGVIE